MYNVTIEKRKGEGKMNIKYTSEFPKIVSDVSSLYVSSEERSDGSTVGYSVCYSKDVTSIARKIMFFEDKKEAGNVIEKVLDVVNGKSKKRIFDKNNNKIFNGIIDLDKIREEVKNER